MESRTPDTLTGAPGGTVRRVAGWWAREQAALAARPGRVAAAVRWLAVRPAVVLLPPAAISPGLFGAAVPDGDGSWFREAGLSMLGPGLLEVFSASGLQIGPLYLLLVGLLAAAADLVGLPVLFTVAAVQSAGLAAYALHLSARWARELGADPLRARWGVVAPLVLLGPLAESIGNGHPEELLLGLMLAHLVLLVRRGRATPAGVVLGLMVGLKLWGVLAAPLVLLARRRRVLVVVAAWPVVLGAGAYLPFALAGELNTFEFSWGARVAPFGVELQGAFLEGWGFRVVQAAVVASLVALVAWRWPGTGLGAALTLVAVRVVLDPLLQMYYTIPFVALALVWVWTAPSAGGRWTLASWPLVLCSMLGPYLLPTTPKLALTHAAMLAVAVAVVRADHRWVTARRPGGGPAASGGHAWRPRQEQATTS